MDRRGDASLVKDLLITLAIIVIIVLIIVGIKERFTDDIDDLSACESRVANVGGRGFCATNPECTIAASGYEQKKNPSATEYTQYLGVECLNEEGKSHEAKQYCCAILPNGVNPPTRVEASDTATARAVGG